jgi:hypothetical protein
LVFWGKVEKSKYENLGTEHGAMIKKKAKGKTEAKKSAKKKSGAKSKKEINPAEVRKELVQMVGAEATLMTQAVIDEGKKGQLATVKYLLEMAAIYPASTDGSQASENEDCLARTLLNRLDLPDEPIARDEEDEPRVVAVAVKAETKADSASESESGGPGVDSTAV